MIVRFAAAFLLAFPSANGADDPVAEAYRILAETRLTHIDIDGDGEVDVFRSYDSDWNLREIWISDPTRTPRTTLRTVISEDGGQGRTRMARSLSFGAGPGGKVVWEQTERRLFGVVRSVEHVSGSSRWIQEHREGKVVRTTYDGEREVSRTERPERADHLTAAALAQVDRQLGCLRGLASGRLRDEAACRAEIVNSFESIGRITDFTRFTPLSCADSTTWEYHLGNGFRIDLQSCFNHTDPPPATVAQFTDWWLANAEIVNTIRSATNAISGDLIACLRDINPDLADTYALRVQENNPTIYCGGQARLAPGIADRACAGSTEPTCGTFLRTELGRAPGDPERPAAFTWESTPGAIYLQNVDPAPNASDRGRTRTPSAAALSAAAGPEERMRIRNANYTGPSMASLLFHEFLHRCDVETEEMRRMHASENKSQYDPVFGCQSVCAMGGVAATYEGCMGCAEANPGNPEWRRAIPSETAAMCRRLYPRNAVVAALNVPATTAWQLAGCRAAAEADRAADGSCTTLRATAEYRAAGCGGASAPSLSDACLDRVRARVQRSFRAVVDRLGEEGRLAWPRTLTALQVMDAAAEVEGFDPTTPVPAP